MHIQIVTQIYEGVEYNSALSQTAFHSILPCDIWAPPPSIFYSNPLIVNCNPSQLYTVFMKVFFVQSFDSQITEIVIVVGGCKRLVWNKKGLQDSYFMTLVL